MITFSCSNGKELLLNDMAVHGCAVSLLNTRKTTFSNIAVNNSQLLSISGNVHIHSEGTEGRRLSLRGDSSTAISLVRDAYNDSIGALIKDWEFLSCSKGIDIKCNNVDLVIETDSDQTGITGMDDYSSALSLSITEDDIHDIDIDFLGPNLPNYSIEFATDYLIDYPISSLDDEAIVIDEYDIVIEVADAD